MPRQREDGRRPEDHPEGPSVVIAHDFAETYGGAERVTAEIAAEFSTSAVYAILGKAEVARRMGVADRFHTLIAPPAVVAQRYRLLAPVYPALVRARSLPSADVLITSSYAYALGLRTVNSAPQLCYCHGPLRHAWAQVDAYAQNTKGGRLGRAMFPAFAAAMRSADRRAARRVTRFLTQSEYTADQIGRYYDAEATLLPPPIDLEVFRPADDGPDGYFLFAGRLVEAYKKPSLVVEAFSRLPDERLVIAGDGPEMAHLRRIAPPNVTFVGHVETPELVRLMGRSRATIFPSVDDFGLVPIEVAACGRPTLAFAGGGALHTVEDGVTGRFFHEQSADAIVEAVRGFRDEDWRPATIRASAQRWERSQFRSEIRRHVNELAGLSR